MRRFVCWRQTVGSSRQEKLPVGMDRSIVVGNVDSRIGSQQEIVLQRMNHHLLRKFVCRRWSRKPPPQGHHVFHQGRYRSALCFSQLARVCVPPSQSAVPAGLSDNPADPVVQQCRAGRDLADSEPNAEQSMDIRHLQPAGEHIRRVLS